MQKAVAEMRRSALEKLLLERGDGGARSRALFDALLIKSVKERPNLYNTKRFDYRDPEKRNTSWEEIAAITGESVHDCHVRWKQLRDRYVREKKYEKTHPLSANRWPLTPKLDFIGAYIRHRRRFSSKNPAAFEAFDSGTERESSTQMDESWSPEDAQSGMTDEGDEVIPVDSNDQNETGLPIVVELLEGADSDSFISADLPNDDSSNDKHANTSTIIANVKTEAETATTESKDSLSEDATSSMTTGKPNQGPNDLAADEEELFGLSVAATLRRLDPKERALAKVKIHEVLYKIEFGSS